MMLDQKIAEELANKGKGAGLQDTLFKQLNNRL
jgi:Rod binding domain-containing protein